MLRSRSFDWFDAMGVDDIPAFSAGEIVGPSVVYYDSSPLHGFLALWWPRSRVGESNVSNLTARSVLDSRFTAAGIRKTCFSRADDAYVRF